MEAGPELDALIAEKVMGGESIEAISVDEFIESCSNRLRNVLMRSKDGLGRWGSGKPYVDVSHFNSINSMREMTDDQLIMVPNIGEESVKEFRSRLGKIQKIKPYSSSISAAWEVVDKILDRNRWGMRLLWDCNVNRWACCFTDIDSNIEYHAPQNIGIESKTHAICLAALKAVGHTFEQVA